MSSKGKPGRPKTTVSQVTVRFKRHEAVEAIDALEQSGMSRSEAIEHLVLMALGLASATPAVQAQSPLHTDKMVAA
ncbi:hypothetical protein HD597_012821 [Nonomuraea thailandensis]|uniref:Ribbon-helix-helix protein, CopG family n=1 Tax=Nonomuraea thailandensis TaxID=1188745 RepID=A0A9X2GXX2_9ACTN|nr:hypothetical protein [Nonomuraea thailandensis]MCP2365717.1 hypothetical protein [Nonomuraea thailandensis]